MQKTSCYSASHSPNKPWLGFLLLVGLLLPVTVSSANLGETLQGFYTREGNDGSPAQTAGNHVYLKFYADRWVGLLFVPYTDGSETKAGAIERIFAAAKQRSKRAAYLKGDFGVLGQKATVQIERYGYLQDRIAFECGALSACTIKLGDGYLELIKPGVINEHIVRYQHVGAN